MQVKLPLSIFERVMQSRFVLLNRKKICGILMVSVSLHIVWESLCRQFLLLNHAKVRVVLLVLDFLDFLDSVLLGRFCR